ncbi:hypothetical protein GCM10027610_104760 [Dactylosporangium cerinum]
MTWRHGSRHTKANPTAATRSRFLRLRIRLANRDIPRNRDGSLPQEWLIAEWPTDATEPVKYWLSNMDTRTSLESLVRLAKLRWRVEHDYRELKTGLGIDHFEAGPDGPTGAAVPACRRARCARTRPARRRPSHQPGGVTPAGVEREPVHRLTIRQAFQALQHHHRRDHRRRHRPAAHRREQISEYAIREHHVAMFVQEREDRVRRQRLAAEPGHRIQQV